MEIEREYEPEPLAVRNVRQFIGKSLHDTDAPTSDIVLVASELATNAVAHARTPFRVRLTGRNGVILLQVSDGSPTLPTIEGLSQSRRGLRLVETVSSRWGVEPTRTGKTVWAEFERTSP